MGFSRQEYWSGLPCPPPGDLPDPGIEFTSLSSPALAGRFFTTSTTWEALGIRQALPNIQRWQMIANIDQLSACSVTQLCPTLRDLRTAAHQALLFVEFSSQDDWSDLPFPAPEDLPNPGIESSLLCLLQWQADSLPLSHLGSIYDELPMTARQITLIL